MKERESSDLRMQAEAHLLDLQTRETALNAKITSLETERGQEAALRDEYQVGKEGEGMITIVDKPATTSSNIPQEAQPIKTTNRAKVSLIPCAKIGAQRLRPESRKAPPSTRPE